MGILSAKYQAHRLVNGIFYIIIFGVGVLVGLGVKFAKIDNIKEIFNKYLFIEDVEAYTIATKNGYTFDEDFIYNSFVNRWSDFSLDYNSNIACVSESNNYWQCVALVNNQISSLSTDNGGSGVSRPSGSSKFAYKFRFNTSNGTYSYDTPSSGYIYLVRSISGWKYVTNYSSLIEYNSTFTNDFSSYNKLDFSTYTIPEMVYDEDLFANDDNFKEVCVNNYDTFSITSKNILDYDSDNNPIYHDFDFIWFKNGVKGLSTWLYDSEEPGHVIVFDKQDDDYLSSPYGWYFWLNSVEEIDKYWNSPNSPGIELKTKGYIDKYKYYNYTFYPFMMTFNNSFHKYQVFWFREPKIEYIDFSYNSSATSSVLGAGVNNIKFDENGNVVETSDKFCFYIKKEYDVNILNKNEIGDVYGDITVLGNTTFHDSTSYVELHTNSQGLFSNLTNFITRMSSTIGFINLNIYEFYLSMPLIVRMFLLSILTLGLIRIIIGMVVK